MKILRVRILGLAILISIVVAIFYLTKNDENLNTTQLPSLSEAIEDWDQQNLTTFSDIGFMMGKKAHKASLRSVVFIDFQCEDCSKNFQMNFEKIKRPLSLNVIYKLYPKDSHCNGAFKNSLDSLSCDLSYLALCAQDKGMSDEVILKEIFTTYNELKVQDFSWYKIFESIRVRLNVETSRYRKCVLDTKINYKLQKMIKEANSDQTFALPGVYIQNRFYIAGNKTTAVESLYDQLLNSFLKP